MKLVHLLVVILYADQNFMTEGRCTEGEVSPDPSDKTCKRYFLCSNGRLVEQLCLKNFVYSKTIRTCVPPSSSYNDCYKKPYEAPKTTKRTIAVYTTRRPKTTTYKPYPRYRTTTYKPYPRCKEGETRPHPQDCKSYYVCSYNVWIPKVCPKNNVYSKTVGKCVLSYSPYDYCSKTMYKTTPTTTTTPVYTTYRPTTTTYKPYPRYRTTTRKYYQRCKEGETRPHPQDCKSYYVCSYNVWIPKVCPKNNVYSKTVGKCVLSYSPYDYCSKTTYKRMTTTTPVYTTTRYMTTTRKYYQRCKEGETRPHPQDCKSYYVCSYNVWNPKVCPKNNVYSKTVGKCVLSYSPYDYCSKTTYKRMTTTTPVYTTTRYRTTTRKYRPRTTTYKPYPKYRTTTYKPYPRCKEGETRPHPQDCKSYYVCSYNVWIPKVCPKNNVYSKTVGKCVLSYSPYDYCSKTTYKRMTTTTPVYTTTRYRTTTRKYRPRTTTYKPYPKYRTTTYKPYPRCKEGETRPHPQDCKSYYVCSYNVWIPKVCPKNNVYSKTVGKCVLSYSPYDYCSKTTYKMTTTTTEYPEYIEQTTPTKSCTSGETYPVRNNCYRYYYCSNGMMHQRTCVFDFVYSKSIKRCVPEHSKYADCKA